MPGHTRLLLSYHTPLVSTLFVFVSCCCHNTQSFADGYIWDTSHGDFIVWPIKSLTFVFTRYRGAFVPTRLEAGDSASEVEVCFSFANEVAVCNGLGCSKAVTKE